MIKESIVDVSIDISMLGFEAYWDLLFCLPINRPCWELIVKYAWNFIRCTLNCCGAPSGVRRRHLLAGMPPKTFFPISHNHQDIEYLTAENAPKIISPSDLQQCESGILHQTNYFAEEINVEVYFSLFFIFTKKKTPD